MAFTTTVMPTSFKVEILKGVHNFSTGSGQTFKLALYDNSASFTAATTAYTTTNEVAASGSYTAVSVPPPAVYAYESDSDCNRNDGCDGLC